LRYARKETTVKLLVISMSTEKGEKEKS